MLIGGALAVIGAVAIGMIFFMRGKDAPAIGPKSIPPGERKNWLMGVGGPVEGKYFFVGTRTVTMGRAPSNQIQLPETGASRVHCRVRPSPDGGLEIVDMNSKNAVYINGRHVKSGHIGPQDELRIGNCRFKYVEKANAPMPDAGLGKKRAGFSMAIATLDGHTQIDSRILEAMDLAEGDIGIAAKNLGIPAAHLEAIFAQAEERPTEAQ